MLNNLKVKSLSLEVSDLDPEKGIVSGYLAAFDVMDSDGEMFRKGAFTDSLEKRGPKSLGNRKIAHLFDHDWSSPIGRFTELFEDEFGLRFVSKLGRSQKAKDVLYDYQDGILREHSVGFYYKNAGTNFKSDASGKYTELTDINMFEGSTVTFGANSLTPVLEVKSEKKLVDELAKLEEEMDKYLDIISKGEGTDERFYQLEMGLKTLKAKYRELYEKYNSSKEIITGKYEEEKQEESPKFSAIKTLNIYLSN